MSHKWIADAVKKDKTLTSEGLKIKRSIRDFEDEEISCPYERWISLVTGRQFDQHKRSKPKGSVHNVQHIVKLPDNILQE